MRKKSFILICLIGFIISNSLFALTNPEQNSEKKALDDKEKWVDLYARTALEAHRACIENGIYFSGTERKIKMLLGSLKILDVKGEDYNKWQKEYSEWNYNNFKNTKSDFKKLDALENDFKRYLYARLRASQSAYEMRLLTYKLIDAMLYDTKKNDPFSYHAPSLDYINFLDSLIGASKPPEGFVFTLQDDKYVVTYIWPNSPADKAGMRILDEIIEINGYETKRRDGESLWETNKKIIEKAYLPNFGKWNFRIKRGNEILEIKIELEKTAKPDENQMPLPPQFISKTYTYQDGNRLEKVLYIRPFDFSLGTAEHFRKSLLNNANCRGLIIDLRDNGGGSILELAEILRLFLNNDLVFYIQSPTGMIPFYISPKENISYPVYQGPIVFLINATTASASESLIFILKEQLSNVGIMGNEATYGKNTVQYRRILPDQSILHLSLYKILSPQKRDRQYIYPDFRPLPLLNEKMSEEKEKIDNDVRRAIEEIKLALQMPKFNK